MARMMARPPAPWPSISVQSMSKRARRSTAWEYRRRGREVANRDLPPPPARLCVRRHSSAAGGRLAAMAGAGGRLAEAGRVAVVALQWPFAARDVLADLLMDEGRRDPAGHLPLPW